MKTNSFIIATVWIGLAFVVAGCPEDVDPAGSGSPLMDFLFADAMGTRVALPAVTQVEAFDAARTVLAQRYTIASADPATGIITTEPEPLGDAPDRLMGQTATRQVVGIRIRSLGADTSAIATVAIQRQGSAVYRQFEPYEENYDSVPNKTPALSDAAATAEQKDTWETLRHDAAIERELLDDVQRMLALEDVPAAE